MDKQCYDNFFLGEEFEGNRVFWCELKGGHKGKHKQSGKEYNWEKDHTIVDWEMGWQSKKNAYHYKPLDYK
ncbi:hypothetical protein LCGC14_0406670 [marine sediment metagenome]|uniref:Uncharacterized protein n=1 Tax=marine sediment metagenome TaxID=412755 RepID=A0A0F9TD76_9ZZZZ